MNKKEGPSNSVTEIIEEGFRGKEDKEEVISKEGDVEKNGSEIEKVSQNTAMEAEVEEGEVVKGWSNVSPGKTSISKKKTSLLNMDR